MKAIIVLLFANVLFVASYAAKHSGYYVTKNNDTIYTTFRMAINMAGEPNLKMVRNSVRALDSHKKTFLLYPDEVKYINFITQRDSFKVELVSRNGMFLFAYGTGKLSVYITEFDDAMWILNRYQSPTKTIFFIELEGKAMFRYQGRITHQDWINLLGEDYPDFVECLQWERKKKREMRDLGIPCFWEGKTLYEITDLFNKKYQ